MSREDVRKIKTVTKKGVFSLGSKLLLEKGHIQIPQRDIARDLLNIETECFVVIYTDHKSKMTKIDYTKTIQPCNMVMCLCYPAIC